MFAATASNISSVITPQLSVSAAGKDALLPSDELTVSEVPFAVTDKLVAEFVVTSDPK